MGARATLLFFNITKTSPITTSTVGSQTVAQRHRSFRLADSRITVFIHGEALYGRATETEWELFIGGYCTHDQREKGNWKVFQAAAFLSHWIHTAAYIPSRVIVAAYKVVTMQPRPWQSDTAWISEIRPTSLWLWDYIYVYVPGWNDARTFAKRSYLRVRASIYHEFTLCI